MYDCLTKRNIPSEAFIEKKLTEILNDFIQFEKEEIDDFETEEERIALKKKKYKLPETFESAIPVYPDSNYKWEERVDSVGLKPILENIKIKNQKTEKNQNENTMKLRKKFWNDYISQRKRYKTDKEFITQWCEKRGEITVEGEMTITKSTASKLLTQFKANEGIVYTKKRLGVKPKINDSSRLCILATIMDYPFMTDKERSVYLNTYGPNDENKVTKKQSTTN